MWGIQVVSGWEVIFLWCITIGNSFCTRRRTAAFKFVGSESTGWFILGQGNNFCVKERKKGRKYEPGFSFLLWNFSPCRSPHFNLFLSLSSLVLRWQFHQDGRILTNRFLKASWWSYNDVVKYVTECKAENSALLDKTCMSKNRNWHFLGIWLWSVVRDVIWP